MILIHARKFFQYWEKAEFPFELVPKLAQLKVSGGTIQVCSFSFCRENQSRKNIDIFLDYHQNGRSSRTLEAFREITLVECFEYNRAPYLKKENFDWAVVSETQYL